MCHIEQSGWLFHVIFVIITTKMLQSQLRVAAMHSDPKAALEEHNLD
jgi:hypothetical protein